MGEGDANKWCYWGGGLNGGFFEAFVQKTVCFAKRWCEQVGQIVGQLSQNCGFHFDGFCVFRG